MVPPQRRHEEIGMNLFDLTGAKVLITGGLGGVGRGVAKAFVAAGAEVALVDSDIANGDAAIREIAAEGRAPLVIEADVTRKASVEAAVAQCLAAMGRIDVLFNNAGIIVRGAATEASEADFDRIFAVNVRGVFLFGQAVARHMIPRRAGVIINNASIAAMIGIAGSSIYCASKGAVLQFTRAWAVEWAPHNVRVNALAPTFLRTPFTAEVLAIPGREEQIAAKTPMGRIGEVADVAGAVLYLASPAAALVTGHVMTVDGGWTAL
ncbi:MAG: glucose 1-dehydrogenase [Alphaproteobacteria bacterium]|nr:glucose 1-dehydrogenase [Alphaproteobacteria bacterium]